MKVFSVRISPSDGQYLYIVASNSPEEARDMVKEEMGKYYEDEDWTINPPNDEYFSFCEIVEQPNLVYNGETPTIVDYGGCEE